MSRLAGPASPGPSSSEARGDLRKEKVVVDGPGAVRRHLPLEARLRLVADLVADLRLEGVPVVQVVVQVDDVAEVPPGGVRLVEIARAAVAVGVGDVHGGVEVLDPEGRLEVLAHPGDR